MFDDQENETGHVALALHIDDTSVGYRESLGFVRPLLIGWRLVDWLLMLVGLAILLALGLR